MGELTLRCLGIADANGVERVVVAIDQEGAQRELVIRDLYGGRLAAQLLARSPEEVAARNAQAAVETERHLAEVAVERAERAVRHARHALAAQVGRGLPWNAGAMRLRGALDRLRAPVGVLQTLVERDPWPAGSERLRVAGTVRQEAEAVLAGHGKLVTEVEGARQAKFARSKFAKALAEGRSVPEGGRDGGQQG